jgi:hypothetical protein
MTFSGLITVPQPTPENSSTFTIIGLLHIIYNVKYNYGVIIIHLFSYFFYFELVFKSNLHPTFTICILIIFFHIHIDFTSRLSL